MNKHFGKKDDRRSALASENDSRNLAELTQLQTVKCTGESIACSRIRLFKVMVDSSLKLTNVEK